MRRLRPPCHRPMVCCVPVLFVASFMVAFVPGCGSGRPETVPVSGVVLLDGQPLKAEGTVRVIPKKDRPATGEIDPATGRFTLKTFDPGDGCVRGTHTVTVLARQTTDDNQIRWLIPEKYSQPGTSGLTVTIDGPTDQVKIKLESEAGGPPAKQLDTSGDSDPSKL